MPNITYLIGAGASANAVATVREIPHRLFLFLEFLKGNRQSPLHNLASGKSFPQVQVMLFEEVEKLLQAVGNHQSIDTYAKKLWLTNQTEKYWLTKTIISFFFTWQQHDHPIDLRYDSFFASILKSTATSFPDNLKIVSRITTINLKKHTPHILWYKAYSEIRLY